ncbi:hypothetical protein ACFQ08_38720 [Streptosporangium algeriense]|uniref:Uncharacterized protein n=1 Tax=Streptosporangium algeriense TaxID=1682748 RepID=A0ABW3E662_9ACTN
MSHVSSSLGIYSPRAEEMSLTASINPGSTVLYLNLATSAPVWFAIGAVDERDSLESEAAAMDRLAELATEAAARLRALAMHPGEEAA